MVWHTTIVTRNRAILSRLAVCVCVCNWCECDRNAGICYLMEQFGDTFKKVNLDDFLGPIASSKLLKSKCFLLTCTIPIRTVNGTSNERQVCTAFELLPQKMTSAHGAATRPTSRKLVALKHNTSPIPYCARSKTAPTTRSTTTTRT